MARAVEMVCVRVCLCAATIVTTTTDPYGPQDFSTVGQKPMPVSLCVCLCNSRMDVCTCRMNRVIFMTRDYPEDTTESKGRSPVCFSVFLGASLTNI